jgi:hypothetical protein
LKTLAEDYYFLKELLDGLQALGNALGEEKRPFARQVSELLSLIPEQSQAARVHQQVDEIIAYGLTTRAAGKIQRMVKSAQRKAARIEAADFKQVTRPKAGGKSHEGTSHKKETTHSKAGKPQERIARQDVVDTACLLLQILEPKDLSKAEAAHRYLNVMFLEQHAQTTLPADQPLVVDEYCWLSVAIELQRLGLGKDAVGFPTEVLAQAWKDQSFLPLTVWVSSQDFEISPSQLATIRLPAKADESDRALFLVKPKRANIQGRLKVDVFYKGNLLQSRLVTAWIVPAAGTFAINVTQPAQDASIVFTAVDELNPDQMAELPERLVTIQTERDPSDGSMDFRFLDRSKGDGQVSFFDTPLQGNALEKLVSDARLRLAEAVTGIKQPVVKDGFCWNPDGDMERLNFWMPRLAQAGRILYRTLLPAPAPGESNPEEEQLKAALTPGTIVQVNPLDGLTTLPWGLLYDRDFLYQPEKNSICPDFATCAPGCSICASSTDKKVVCPYAFWGFKYQIEQIPAWVPKELPPFPALARRIANGKPLQLDFNIYDKFLLWQKHQQKLESPGRVQVFPVKTTGDLIDLLSQHGAEMDILYFYCHGGTDAFGQASVILSDASFNATQFAALGVQLWHAPLVFLNGCATGAYGPQDYLGLINQFRASGASGVMGTECPVLELFAEAFASAFFPRLFDGQSVGKALLNVRLDLLQKRKNPLGLVYSLYAATEVQLAQPLTPAPGGNEP